MGHIIGHTMQIMSLGDATDPTITALTSEVTATMICSERRVTFNYN